LSLKGVEIKGVEIKGVEIKGVEFKGVEFKGVEFKKELRLRKGVEFKGVEGSIPHNTNTRPMSGNTSILVTGDFLPPTFFLVSIRDFLFFVKSQ
jgi:hypothetical protein